jgi:hypothetical protein
MKDPIFLVDPATRNTVAVWPTTFFELNVKERQDLQAWLMNRTDVLGEPLLLITSEFDRFDKSDRRLDLLLLDKNARIVVAELKLDASGTLADQQAIRYAAFCSTMTMDDVLDLYARTSGASADAATQGICEFLQVQDLPRINGEPRVMLVAGSFEDQELTTTVMWLRKFGVDITCVEVTPYRYPGDEQRILLIPKTLIPLPEAREYQVSVERKEQAELLRNAPNVFSQFYGLVLDEYGKLDTLLTGPRNPSSQDWMSLHFGNGQMHYEWLVRKRAKAVDVAVHFEGRDQATNLRRLESLLEKCPGLANSFDRECIHGQWGKMYAQFAIRVPYEGAMPGPDIARDAADTMAKLVGITLPVLKQVQ